MCGWAVVFPMSPRKRVRSLRGLALHSVADIFVEAAAKGDDALIHRYLAILRNVGLLREACILCLERLESVVSGRSPSSSVSDAVVRILLPNLVAHSSPDLKDLRLHHDFLRQSALARSVLGHSIRFFSCLERLDVSGNCSDALVVQLSQHCPGLRHLTANRSKTLSDVALGALAGTHRVSAGFVRGCKKLRRLEISGCYLITASKIVSLLLFLPQIQYLHCPERMEQVFESSALFESGLRFSLTNLEHRVSHLERAREKINHHLGTNEQFLTRVSEIFPDIRMVRLMAPRDVIAADNGPVAQLSAFRSLQSLVLEQTSCYANNLNVDNANNFRPFQQPRLGGGNDSFLNTSFLYERGSQLKKICLRVECISVADIVAAIKGCPNLRSLQVFAVTLEMADHRRWAVEIDHEMSNLLELSLGCVDVFCEYCNGSSEDDEAVRGDPGGGDLTCDAVCTEFVVGLLKSSPSLKSLSLKSTCAELLSDKIVQRELLDGGKISNLRKFSVHGKTSLGLKTALQLLTRCASLHILSAAGWKLSPRDVRYLKNFVRSNNLDVHLNLVH